MEEIRLSKFRKRLYRGVRILGFEFFVGLSGGLYVMRLPVGFPHRLF